MKIEHYITRVAATLLCLLIWLSIGAAVHAQTQRNWQVRAPMPTPRAGASAVVYGNKVYVLGGKNASGAASNVVEVYDPVEDSWSSAPGMAVGRYNSAATVLDGKIYIAGGRGSTNDVVLSSVEVFDPDTGQWAQTGNLTSRREGLSAVVLDDVMYVLGGSNENEQFLNTVEFFGTLQNSWQLYNNWNLGVGRASFASVVYADSAFSFGGFSTFGPLGITQRYHPVFGLVERAGFLPARGGLSAAVLDDAIYVIGGKTGNNEPVATVNRFIPAENRWDLAAPLRETRERAPAISIEDQIFVFGGASADGAVLGSVEAFDTVVAPIANGDAAATNEDTFVDVDVLLNDTDPAAGNLLISAFTQPANGLVSQIQPGILRYQPSPNFSGNDLFSYTIENSAGGTALAIVQIIVAPIEDPPAFLSTPETSALVDVAYTYEIQVDEPDGDPVTIEATTLPEWLQFTDQGNGMALLAGTPTSANLGAADIELVASDGALTAIQTFQLAVINDIPNIPQPILPENEARITESSVTFTWSEQPGVSYQFQLAFDNLFTTPVIDTLLSETSLLINNIIPERGYYWRIRASNAAGISDWSDVFNFNLTSGVDIEDELPSFTSLLHPAYPNPFHDRATISFDLQRSGQHVEIDIFDLNGRRITTLLSQSLPAGSHQTSWDGHDIRGRRMASGIYVVRLRMAGGTLHKNEIQSQLLTLISN